MMDSIQQLSCTTLLSGANNLYPLASSDGLDAPLIMQDGASSPSIRRRGGIC
jgi:hypothetical protein